MPKLIHDEFTDLAVSRARKHQLRMVRDGRCMICGKPAMISGLCLKHRIARRENARKRLGRKRRSYNALSYRLEAQAKAAAKRKRNKQSG
jgi:hypothetical protein